MVQILQKGNLGEEAKIVDLTPQQIIQSHRNQTNARNIVLRFTGPQTDREGTLEFYAFNLAELEKVLPVLSESQQELNQKTAQEKQQQKTNLVIPALLIGGLILLG